MKKYKFLGKGNLLFSRLQDAYPYLHCHEYWEFCLITDGPLMHIINNRKNLIKRGALMLIRPEDVHKFEQYDGYKTTQINLAIRRSFFETITTAFSPTLLDRLKEKESILIELDNASVIFYERQGIKLQLMSKEAEGYQNESLLLFLSFFEKVIRYLTLSDKLFNNSYSDAVMSIIKRMEDIKYISLGVKELLSDSHYSHGHIIRKFRAETGKTPSQYFNDIKLRYAKTLLETTNLSILDISLEIGFSSVGHFGKTFKKIYEITPSQYRKKWNAYYNSLG